MSAQAFLTLRRPSHVPWSPVAELEARCEHATMRRRLPMPRAWNRDAAGVVAIAALLTEHHQRAGCACTAALAAKYRAARAEVSA